MFAHLLTLVWNNLITVGLVFVVYIFVCWIRRRPSNLPPGPWAIPFIGSPAIFARDQERVYTELRHKYGDVYMVYGGSKPMVVIGGADMIREALIKHGHATSYAASSVVTDLVCERKGLLSVQGQFWKEQRTFTVSKLRQFGMGKVSLENRVLEEVQVFVEYLQSFDGRPVDMKGHIVNSISNVILSVLVGKRFSYDDPKLLEFIRPINENFLLLSPAVNIYPWLRHIPGDPFNFKTIMKNLATFRSFLRDLIQEHKKDVTQDNVRDFIDAYMVELQDRKGEENSSFSETQLEFLVGDLATAGSDTTATTIYWGILYLAHHPEIQQAVQEEIDSVVGPDRHASILDKPQLPYTEATIMEIQRIANIGLFVPPHATSEEITLNGYTIPKGTTLLFLLADSLSDPDVWENPKQFNPRRFLVDGKVIHTDKFFPFSIGRRSCPGEALAKMELFLFFTALLQKFTFKFPEDEPSPSTERVAGFTFSPHPFRVRSVARQYI